MVDNIDMVHHLRGDLSYDHLLQTNPLHQLPDPNSGPLLHDLLCSV